MKYISDRILTAVICLLALVPVASFAASGDSEAEYRKLAKSWTLNPDGSQEFHYSMELTLFTHTAMNGTYGESFIVYNPEYQTLEINSSYTVRKDGTVVGTPSNAFVEVLPSPAANAPAYNGLKEMVVVHTGLELGATICLDYTIVTKAGYLPELDVYELVRQSSPVKEYTVSISVPESKEPDFYLYGIMGKVSSATAGGQKTYTWTFRNVKASSRLPDQYHFDSPYFAANTYSSPEIMARTVSRRFADGKSLPVLKDLAGKITSGAVTETEKVRAVYRYIQDSYARIPLDLYSCGYRIRPADRVIASAYGTDAELLNVFQGLLAASGLKAGVCAVYPRQNTAGLGLRHMQLYVVTEADGREYLLSPSALGTRSVVMQRQYCPALNLKTGSIESPAPKSAMISGSFDISLEGEKMLIRSETEVSDFFLDVEGTVARMITAGDDDADVKSSDSSSVFICESESDVERAGDYTILHLPDYPFSAVYDRRASGSERDILLTLPAPYDESYVYRVHKGDRTLCSPETDIKTENSVGELGISISDQGDDVIVIRTLKLYKPEISVEEYPDFLELMRVWGDHNHTCLLMKQSM